MHKSIPFDYMRSGGSCVVINILSRNEGVQEK